MLITKTLVKKIIFISFFSFIVSGCALQNPDAIQTISAKQLNQVMQEQEIFLLDVHTPRQKAIKGTDLFIPYNKISEFQNQLPSDKNAAIYIYCEGGPMGNTAAKSLYNLGYRKLFNLQGGAIAWKQNGFSFE